MNMQIAVLKLTLNICSETRAVSSLDKYNDINDYEERKNLSRNIYTWMYKWI